MRHGWRLAAETNASVWAGELGKSGDVSRNNVIKIVEKGAKMR